MENTTVTITARGQYWKDFLEVLLIKLTIHDLNKCWQAVLYHLFLGHLLVLYDSFYGCDDLNFHNQIMLLKVQYDIGPCIVLHLKQNDIVTTFTFYKTSMYVQYIKNLQLVLIPSIHQDCKRNIWWEQTEWYYRIISRSLINFIIPIKNIMSIGMCKTSKVRIITHFVKSLSQNFLKNKVHYGTPDASEFIKV